MVLQTGLVVGWEENKTHLMRCGVPRDRPGIPYEGYGHENQHPKC